MGHDQFDACLFPMDSKEGSFDLYPCMAFLVINIPVIVCLGITAI